MAEHKISKVSAEIIAAGDETMRVSQLHVSALGAGGNAFARVSQLHVSVLGADVSTTSRVSQLHVAVLVNHSVDLTWCDVFIEERFPTFIRYTSEGGPTSLVLQQKTTGGRTQRVALHDELYGRWNVGFQRGAAEMDALTQFVEVVGGPEIGFRFKDHRDFTTAAFIGNERDAITGTDQSLGTGDGATAAHQLIRTSVAGASSRVKSIYKPVAGTVIVTQDAIVVGNYTLDLVTGVVTWTPRTTVTGTDISFVDAGAGNWVIRSTSTSWANFVTGESIRVAGSTLNDTASPLGVYVITGSVPAGSGDLDVVGVLVNEAAGATVTVDVHPYPRTGVVLAWGGEYDKPVHILENSFPVRYVEGKGGDIQSAGLQLEEIPQVSTL